MFENEVFSEVNHCNQCQSERVASHTLFANVRLLSPLSLNAAPQRHPLWTRKVVSAYMGDINQESGTLLHVNIVGAVTRLACQCQPTRT